jgi:uncharacterized protein (TIGR03000 family)
LTGSALLVAACVLLTPQVASAQVFIGGGGLFGRPTYLSPYTGPANRLLYNPYGYGPLGGGMYGGPLTGGLPVSPAAGVPGVGGYTGYISPPYAPGLYNFSSAVTPITSGGALTPASYSPSLTTGVPLTYGAPLYYNRPLTYVGYPNYVYSSGSITPFPTYYAQYSYLNGPTYAGYPGMYSAYGLGPTTFESDAGGLSVNRPVAGYGAVYAGWSPARMRPTLYPAVAVSGLDSLERESGTADGDDRAHITVILPSGDAEVFFQGSKTNQTGITRDFVSPPLGKGLYSYQVRARWTANGEPVTMSRKVQVRAGERVRVDFTTK